MKKRGFACLLGTLMLMSLAACGGDDKSDKTEATTEATTAAATTEAATEATTEATEATEAETEEETTEAALTGELDVEGATVEALDGWTAEASGTKEIKFNKDGEKGAYVKINYSTKTKTAEEWAHSYDENYGGGNTIDQVTVGDYTFWHLCPVEGQEFLIVDGTEEGSVIKFSSMQLGLDDIKPIVETLKLK